MSTHAIDPEDAAYAECCKNGGGTPFASCGHDRDLIAESAFKTGFCAGQSHERAHQQQQIEHSKGSLEQAYREYSDGFACADFGDDLKRSDAFKNGWQARDLLAQKERKELILALAYSNHGKHNGPLLCRGCLRLPEEGHGESCYTLAALRNSGVEVKP